MKLADSIFGNSGHTEGVTRLSGNDLVRDAYAKAQGLYGPVKNRNCGAVAREEDK